jgi:ABC-2 type transport system permease protein
MTAAAALIRREFIRFTRQPSRIVASVGTPALFWLFLASGFADSFASPGDDPGASYAAFAIPGIATMVILFSTIFAAISLIQDRQAGLLQSVIVSPASSRAVTTAKVGAGACVATVQAALVLIAMFFFDDGASPLAFVASLAACFVTALALTAMGLALAWRVNSTAGFHGVMNLILVPMWLISGAIFPVEGAAGWLRILVLINPLHHANETIAHPLTAGPIHWLVSLAFAALSFTAALRIIRTIPDNATSRTIA